MWHEREIEIHLRDFRKGAFGETASCRAGKTLNERIHSDIAMEMQTKIRSGRGVERAVHVIEKALKNSYEMPAYRAQMVSHLATYEPIEI
jgi:hypothetical protein